MRLTSEQQQILAALAHGAVLKVHRSLDGDKLHRLHPLDDSPVQPVRAQAVASLLRLGLLESNMKFPAATFLLTDKGVAQTRQLAMDMMEPVSIRNAEYLSTFS